MQTEKQRRLASNASSAPRNTRCTTALSSCLSSASSASCPTLPVDLTSKSPKCAPRPRKPEWPRPAPKRECPTRRRCVTRRDCATTAKQKAPRFRRDHEARELANRRRQSNRQHDPRHIPPLGRPRNSGRKPGLRRSNFAERFACGYAVHCNVSVDQSPLAVASTAAASIGAVKYIFLQAALRRHLTPGTLCSFASRLAISRVASHGLDLVLYL